MATKRDATEALRASALWASDSPDDWRAALDAYAQRRDALNHEKLTRLDPWFFDRLTVDVRAREPPCMTAEELVNMVEVVPETRGTVTVLFHKYDSLQLGRVVGVRKAKSMLQAPSDSFMIA